MNLHVKLSSTLRRCVAGYNPQTGLDLAWKTPRAGATARDLAECLNIPVKDIKLVMINGRQQPLDTALGEGDRVAYFPPVGGG